MRVGIKGFPKQFASFEEQLRNAARLPISLAWLVLLAASLCGCGSVSALRGPNGEKLNLSAYDAVRVMDFENAIKNQPERTEVVEVVRLFSSRVVDEVKATGAFAAVTRGGTPEKGELVVTGKVTRYEEGSATARFLIGFGAGSSYFDATIEVRESPDSAAIGTMTVDRNSWALGGAMAATQTPMDFMIGGAKAFAKELSEAKKRTKSEKEQ